MIKTRFLRWLKKNIFFVYILTAMVIIVSCSKQENNKNIIINTAPFTKIEILDVFDVVLSQDTFYQVQIYAAETILPDISAQITTEGTLSINNANSFRWTHNYTRPRIVITFDSLKIIDVKSSSHIKTQNTFSGKYLFIWVLSDLAEINMDIDLEHMFFLTNGATSGNFVFSGKLNFCEIFAFGGSRFDAENLVVNRYDIKQGSINHFYIHALDTIQYEIYKTGNIYYTGNPLIIPVTIKKGSGELIKISD